VDKKASPGSSRKGSEKNSTLFPKVLIEQEGVEKKEAKEPNPPDLSSNKNIEMVSKTLKGAVIH